MDIRKAMTYIQTHGDDLARARATALFEGTPPPESLLDTLRSLQDEEGGWPVGLEAGRPASVLQTCRVLLALEDLGQARSAPARRGLAFLSLRQEADGSWWEQTAGDPPPFWLQEGEEAGRLYLTALVSAVLVTCGRSEEPAADRALDLLLNRQLAGGRFVGPRLTAAYALPILAVRLGRRSGPAQNILHTMAQEFRADWPPAHSAILLRNLLRAGFGLETPLVRTLWEHLLMGQNEDGSWDEQDEAERVFTTLEVVGCWKRILPSA